MKALIATIVSAFALSAFAAEPAKAPATPAPASTPAPAVVKKEDEKKPVKSTVVKDKKQQHQLRQQNQQASNSEADDNDDDGYEQVDVHVAYRRPTIVDDDGDEPLSDYVLDRLKTARILAMLAYYNKAHA